MKHTKVVMLLLILSTASKVLADSSSATPYFSIRSQSANLALEMVGQEGYINRYNSDGNYTVFAITPAFQQSFRKGDLACCLFGPDLVKSGDCSQLTISGSQVANRGSHDWLADYFGLPTDFKSTISFNPRIRNILVDGNFYLGLDEWWHPGMYFKMHIPFVHTRWELDYCETISAKGVNNHPFGYFSGNNPASGTPNFATDGIGNLRSELLNNASEFFSDNKAPNLSNNLTYGPLDGAAATCDTLIDTLNTIAYSDTLIFEPLNYARWAGCNCSPLTKSGVAEWRFTLGYNPYMSEKFHVGFGIMGAAPTGNRPHGEYLFEPIIGNGNHWELGGQFTSHYRFWQSENEDKSITGYFDVNLTHLFKARQTRSFDLKGKPNSRYMLAQKLGEPCYLYNATLQRCILDSTSTNTGTITSGLVEADAQFKNMFAPVANLTTVDVNVNIGAQIDMALMFNYTCSNWSIDLGYNLWARTCERISLDCSCPNRLTDGKTWALKGDAYVFGANGGCNRANLCTQECDGSTDTSWQTSIGTNSPYALGATQSNATINKGTNDTTNVKPFNNTPTQLAAYANQGIDNPRFAVAKVLIEACPAIVTQDRQADDVYSALNATNSALSTNRRIMNSKTPIYLTENDIDFDSAATKGLSHKIFAHVSYQWLNQERGYTPFVGFGASGEFVNNSGDCCASSCSSTTSSTTTTALTRSCNTSTCSTSSSCASDCDDNCGIGCKRCALSQWSIWIKGGFSFN